MCVCVCSLSFHSSVQYLVQLSLSIGSSISERESLKINISEIYGWDSETRGSCFDLNWVLYYRCHGNLHLKNLLGFWPSILTCPSIVFNIIFFFLFWVVWCPPSSSTKVSLLLLLLSSTMWPVTSYSFFFSFISTTYSTTYSHVRRCCCCCRRFALLNLYFCCFVFSTHFRFLDFCSSRAQEEMYIISVVVVDTQRELLYYYYYQTLSPHRHPLYVCMCVYVICTLYLCVC